MRFILFAILVWAGSGQQVKERLVRTTRPTVRRTRPTVRTTRPTDIDRKRGNCPHGESNYCYILGQNSSDVQCNPGYKSNFGGFCCLSSTSTIEDTINSLVPSDFYCHSIENSNVTQCPSDFELCHNKYCCPKTCPLTEADAANSLMTSSFSIISHRKCIEDCTKGARYFAKYVCPRLRGVRRILCNFLVKHFSTPACDALCNKICTS